MTPPAARNARHGASYRTRNDSGLTPYRSSASSIASRSEGSTAARPGAGTTGSALTRFVFVVSSPPGLREVEVVLVAASGGEVEDLVRAHEGLDAARVRRVGVVDDAAVD